MVYVQSEMVTTAGSTRSCSCLGRYASALYVYGLCTVIRSPEGVVDPP
jgi:hypothetical protein